jgi:hypothetical protein
VECADEVLGDLMDGTFLDQIFLEIVEGTMECGNVGRRLWHK